MITPKKQSEISSCSRGCSICRDNLNYSIPLNLNINQDFYHNLVTFFQKNTVSFQEVSFLYYGDFFENFTQVQTGIENLYYHDILKKTSEVSVWVRAEKKINTQAIQYIINWANRDTFRLKFSISLDGKFEVFKNKIQLFYKTLLFLKKIKLYTHCTILLQCNNIEFCKYSIKEKIELHKILHKIHQDFVFLDINFSDFNVKINLDSSFEIDSFSFEKNTKCVYMEKDLVQYSLQKNLSSDQVIYIEHADIFSDAISIHNPYCKKLKSNNFGSLNDGVHEINKKLRKFVYSQNIISESYKSDNTSLSRCDYCIKNHSLIEEKPSK